MKRFTRRSVGPIRSAIAWIAVAQICCAPVSVFASPDALAPGTALQSKDFVRKGQFALFSKNASRKLCEDFERAKGRQLDRRSVEMMIMFLLQYGVFTEDEISDLVSLCEMKYFTYKDTGPYSPTEQEEIWRVFNFLVLTGASAEEIDSLMPYAFEVLNLRGAIEGTFKDAKIRDFKGGYSWKGSRFRKAKLYAQSNAFRGFLDLKPGDTYVDVMGGAGEEAIEIARTHPEAQVVMIDANAKNLLEAVKKAAAAGLENIRFQLRDVRPSRQGLGLPDHSVQAVSFMGWALAGIESGELHEIFGEVLRVLAPRGRIFFDSEMMASEKGAFYVTALDKGVSFETDNDLNRKKDARLYQMEWFGARLRAEQVRPRMWDVDAIEAKIAAIVIKGARAAGKGAAAGAYAFKGTLPQLAEAIDWRGDPLPLAQGLYRLYRKGEIILASSGDSLMIGPGRHAQQVKSVPPAPQEDRDGEDGRPPDAKRLVMSNAISEEWNIRPSEMHPKGIRAYVTFYADGTLIGNADVFIDAEAASMNTCWLRVEDAYRGQLLGSEFAARVFRRAEQIGAIMGINPKLAHAYYTLSRMEVMNEDAITDDALMKEKYDYRYVSGPIARIFKRFGFATAKDRALAAFIAKKARALGVQRDDVPRILAEQLVRRSMKVKELHEYAAQMQMAQEPFVDELTGLITGGFIPDELNRRYSLRLSDRIKALRDRYVKEIESDVDYQLTLQRYTVSPKEFLHGYDGMRHFDRTVPLRELVRTAEAQWNSWYYEERGERFRDAATRETIREAAQAPATFAEQAEKDDRTLMAILRELVSFPRVNPDVLYASAAAVCPGSTAVRLMHEAARHDYAMRVCKLLKDRKGIVLEAGDLEREMDRLIDFGVYTPVQLSAVISLLGHYCAGFEDTGVYSAGTMDEIRRLFNFLTLAGMKKDVIRKIFPLAPDFLGLYRVNQDVTFAFLTAKPRNFKGGYFFPDSLIKGANYFKSDAYRAFLGLRDGDVYLDVMGGAGDEAIGIAKEYPGVRAVMLDANAGNVRKALVNAAAEKLGNIDLILSDVRPSEGGIPLPDGSVNAVTMTGLSLNGYEPGQLREIFEEILRVLAPGGRIFFDAFNTRVEMGALCAAAGKLGKPLRYDRRLNYQRDYEIYPLDWFGVEVAGKGEEPAGPAAVSLREMLEREILASCIPFRNDRFTGTIFDFMQKVPDETHTYEIESALYRLFMAGKINLQVDDHFNFTIERTGGAPFETAVSPAPSTMSGVEARQLYLKIQTIFVLCEGLRSCYGVLEPTHAGMHDAKIAAQRKILEVPRTQFMGLVEKMRRNFDQVIILGATGGDLRSEKDVFPEDMIGTLGLDREANIQKIVAMMREAEEVYAVLKKNVQDVREFNTLVEDALKETAGVGYAKYIEQMDRAYLHAVDLLRGWVSKTPAEVEMEFLADGILPPQEDHMPSLPQSAPPPATPLPQPSVSEADLFGSSS